MALVWFEFFASIDSFLFRFVNETTKQQTPYECQTYQLTCSSLLYSSVPLCSGSWKKFRRFDFGLVRFGSLKGWVFWSGSVELGSGSFKSLDMNKFTNIQRQKNHAVCIKCVFSISYLWC